MSSPDTIIVSPPREFLTYQSQLDQGEAVVAKAINFFTLSAEQDSSPEVSIGAMVSSPQTASPIRPRLENENRTAVFEVKRSVEVYGGKNGRERNKSVYIPIRQDVCLIVDAGGITLSVTETSPVRMGSSPSLSGVTHVSKHTIRLDGTTSTDGIFSTKQMTITRVLNTGNNSIADTWKLDETGSKVVHTKNYSGGNTVAGCLIPKTTITNTKPALGCSPALMLCLKDAEQALGRKLIKPAAA